MKDLITIGLPSKGRLKEKAVSFFEDSGLKILQSDKERNYFANIENKPNIKVPSTGLFPTTNEIELLIKIIYNLFNFELFILIKFMVSPCV